jgi:hypothetical protein
VADEYLNRHPLYPYLAYTELRSAADIQFYRLGEPLMLPEDYDARKALPLYTFMFEYFPLAWLEVVKVAVAGNKQHANDGSGIRWAREKSTDQMNCAFRHIFDYGSGDPIDNDLQYHLAKAIWRLMAQLQLDIESKRNEDVHSSP